VCAGSPACSTRRAKLGEGPALMRQPSRRAKAPMSEMYFERCGRASRALRGEP
jgi:hypothetical protein